MAKLNTISITYKGRDFIVAAIPDIFTNRCQDIYIGPNSLNDIVYDNDKGLVDDTARSIDEQIYAYIDDDYFSLNMEDFLQKVKLYLD